MQLTTRLLRIISSSFDARPVGLIRIIIGIVSIFASLEARRIFSRVLHPETLRLPFVSWLEVPPMPWTGLYITAWFVLGLLFTLGWHTQIAGAALFGLMFVSLFLDQQTYSNHIYLLSLIVLLLSITQSGARYSIDSWRGRGSSYVSRGPVELLKIQLTLVYGFSALAKINYFYLSGEPLCANLDQESFLALPESLQTIRLCAGLSIAAILVELFLAVGLWIKRTRLWAVIAGVLFHTMSIIVLVPSETALAMFAIACISLYLLFFYRSLSEPVA